LEHGGNIYQYVGDEVVTSWPTSPASARKCLLALQEAQKTLKKHEPEFMKKYGLMAEFRVGIHEGEVTVGEIGLVKKDLAMSGDTMNTTARIRTACGDLDKEVVSSGSFIHLLTPAEQQAHTSMGMLDLKGKSQSIELFSFNK
jgi:adenylate cyclase